MLSNALRTANKQNLASRARLIAAPATQRSLHTPIGNTRAKDDGFEVSQTSAAFLPSGWRVRAAVYVDSCPLTNRVCV